MATNIWRKNPSSRISVEYLIKDCLTDSSVGIVNGFWEISGGTPIPIVTLQSYTRIKISDEVGCNTSLVTFRADQNCDQWEARAGGNGTVGVGLLVGSGSAINSGVDVQFNVDWNELTGGDIEYPIDVFAHTSGGWSSRAV